MVEILASLIFEESKGHILLFSFEHIITSFQDSGKLPLCQSSFKCLL